jgi:hypothetical protein
MIHSITLAVFIFLSVFANYGLAKGRSMDSSSTITQKIIIGGSAPISVGECLLTAEPYPSVWNLGKKYVYGYGAYWEEKVLVLIRDRETKEILHKELVLNRWRNEKNFTDGRYYGDSDNVGVDSAFQDCKRWQLPVTDFMNYHKTRKSKKT